MMILWTETLKLKAICEHEPSPAETTYSNGGWRVAVGVSVAKLVAVGVKEGVGVSVGVPASSVENDCGSFGTSTKVNPAAIAITARSEPIATGRLRVSCGRLAAFTERSAFFTTLASCLGENSVPQTRQRAAFSLRRVPQVGQTFVLL